MGRPWKNQSEYAFFLAVLAINHDNLVFQFDTGIS